jgi:hypothetical protein
VAASETWLCAGSAAARQIAGDEDRSGRAGPGLGIVTLTSRGRHEARGVVLCRSSCVLNARLVVPDFETVRPDRVIDIRCKSMSAGMKVTVDE